jgi:nuclease S1
VSARALAERALFIVLVALATGPTPAKAWSAHGHRVIAALAERELEPGTRRAIEALLAPDDERTLVDVATWADELRDTDRERFRQTGRQHFVNVRNAQCDFAASRDCRDGECVVGAIARYERILADRSRPRAERADALRFVVHLIADVHQPLHASPRDDKGGQHVQLRYGRENWNLHSVWDSLILKSPRRSWQDHAAMLSRIRWREPGPVGDPEHWAEESCRIVRDDDLYPAGGRIDERYIDTMRPIAETRVRAAGSRLAVVLNRALGNR